MANRNDQRKYLRERRRALSDDERKQRSALLYRQVTTHPLFLSCRRLAAYLPADGEVDPQPLIERAWQMGKQVYLPVLVPFAKNRLWFARYQPQTRLVNNRFGIAEPESVHRQRIAPYALDLVLAPLVGFDDQGNRLGMGGGFYDRTYQYLLAREHWRKPRLLGLAWEFQHVERLPARAWDVPLSAVATDRKWHSFQVHCTDKEQT